METSPQQSDLIQHLLLEAGRIMEDSTPGLALTLPDDPLKVRERIDRLAERASVLTALARAARALQQ